MPVSRNLSLPASIQGRKYKKRIDCDTMMHVDEEALPSSPSCLMINSSQASTPSAVSSLSKKHFTLPTSPADLDSTCGGGDGGSADGEMTSSRTTLSQPCIGSSSVRATSIFPHLFLGSESDVSDEQLMSEQRITRVLNVSITCQRPASIDDDHFRRIAVHDNYTERIEPHLDEAVQFLEEARLKSERVLVHCVAGVSRSATVAIAYVMYYLRLNQNDAYRFVKEKRPTISPNFNFLGQLIEFERRLRDCGRLPPVDPVNFAASSPDGTARGPDKPAASACEKPYVAPVSVRHTVAPASSHTTTTTFCRRRHGLKLDLTSQSQRDASSSGAGDKLSKKTRGAGVLLDLHVQPVDSDESASAHHHHHQAAVEHSRRLGSDGVEDERHQEIEFDPLGGGGEGKQQKANSLPRHHHLVSHHLMSGGFDYGKQSATAPSTPSMLLNLPAAPVQPSASSEDVEMMSDTSSTSSSNHHPPSPTPPVSSGGVLYVTSYTPTSQQPAQRKSGRSPKVMKKSFTPSLRQSYGYQAFLTTKSSASMAPATAQIDGSIKLHLPNRLMSPGAANQHRFVCTSPGATDRFSTLSLGASNKGASESSGADSKKAALGFKLVPSSELRMRWRHKSPRHVTSASGAPGAGAKPEPPSVEPPSKAGGAEMGCCNMEIVSCS